MKREENLKTAIRVMTALLGIVAVCFVLYGRSEQASSGNVEQERKKPCVVIDAGHGGADPGKVGINGALEKDINLEIVKKLKMFLEQADIEVVLTRDSDMGLYDENASNKKVQDMKRRVEIIETNSPVMTVSIHQNSYHEEYVHGAQTFYYANSEQSKVLAEKIQQLLLNELDGENTRVAKSNDSYYLLKKTSSPIVIVECGFLSNSEEAQKLISNEYQEKLAWAIHLGILQYINSQD
ncbi:MAG: N-acetylmuramoyl-L-alanine amidase [Blautia sp.]|nr:N-acetylmuramoyl-L-alanine amidase [Blautia sp.]MCM1202364.1 N-acetylmuramoyl-L-alanine amidase [Bacteroides fragilis]